MILQHRKSVLKTTDLLNSFLNEQHTCLDKISKMNDEIVKIIDLLIEARDRGSKIYTMGNGGSGSTASHFVSDLLKTSITEGNKRFSAISLVDNIPVLLAWANDVSYDDVFVEQLKNFINKGDVLIGFSGSGKSKNVVKALRHAKETGAICIGFTGMSGGDFPNITDSCFIVPSNDMLLIESIHVMICHCIISVIRNSGKPIFTYG